MLQSLAAGKEKTIKIQSPPPPNHTEYSGEVVLQPGQVQLHAFPHHGGARNLAQVQLNHFLHRQLHTQRYKGNFVEFRFL